MANDSSLFQAYRRLRDEHRPDTAGHELMTQYLSQFVAPAAGRGSSATPFERFSIIDRNIQVTLQSNTLTSR